MSSESKTTQATPSPFRTFANEFIAGSIGGGSGILVGHPLDTIRVRLQTGTSQAGAFQTFTSIVKQEGPTGLYKGMLSPLLGESLNNFVMFGVYGVLKPWQHSFQQVYFENKSKYSLTKDLASILASGFVAGATVSFIVCPTELIKIQLQVNTERAGEQRVGKRGFADCAKHIFKQGSMGQFMQQQQGIVGGIRALYHGWRATLLRDSCFTAFYFLLYDTCKRIMLNHDHSLKPLNSEQVSQLTALQLLSAGGIAGTLSWFVLYPVDTLKSNIQSDLNKHSTLSNQWNALRKASIPIRQQLYKGLVTTLVRAYPVNAVTFLIYEIVFDGLNKI